MNDVKRFILPISIAVPALLAGIAIGHYASTPAAAPTVLFDPNGNVIATPMVSRWT